MTAPDGRRTLIQLRHDTPADWTATNPILAAGEPGWDADGRLKIGDGVTAWNALRYAGVGAWIAPALHPDYATSTGVRYRLEGDSIRIQGLFIRGAAAPGQVAMDLPIGPSTTRYGPAMSPGVGYAYWQYEPSGDFAAIVGVGASLAVDILVGP